MQMERKKNASVPPKAVGKIDPVVLARSFRKTRDDGIRSDVDGSYTGVTRDGEAPVQDVDDL